MKKLSILLTIILLVGCISCEQETPQSQLPKEVQKFVGEWNFTYLQEANFPIPITLETINATGLNISAITLTIQPDYTFQLIGIPSKNVNGTYVLEGDDLHFQLSEASYKELQKQFTTDNFKVLYSQKEGKEKVELVLGKLIITEVPIPLNNTSMFFEK